MSDSFGPPIQLVDSSVHVAHRQILLGTADRFASLIARARPRLLESQKSGSALARRA